MTETPSGPGTIGELRRRLAELGNPWSVHPRWGDADPLPDPPRGAQSEQDVPEQHRLPGLPSGADLGELLTAMPPANPFLRARWVELGLLPGEDTGDGEVRS
jgi:hypothetical protein